jgi:hypothetical protein
MVNKIKGLTVVDFIGGRKGIFQAITKVPAGFMIAAEIGSDIPSLDRWKKGTLQTIQFKAEGTSHWTTVFAKKGTRVILLDQVLAEKIEVGTINSLFYNTNLMDHNQYKAVNAKTWADKAFLLNE